MSVDSHWRATRSGGQIDYSVRLVDTVQSSSTSGLSPEAAGMGKRAPGQNMTIAVLQVLHNHDRESCRSLVGVEDREQQQPPQQQPQQQQHTVTLLSGCPPGRRIEFDVEASRRVPRALNQQHVEVDHGCDESHTNEDSGGTTASNQTTSAGVTAKSAAAAEIGIPCVWAGHDFYPVFRIVDDITTDSVRVYNGSFRLTIVAGGPSLDEMVDYTPEQQVAYSMWPASLNAARHSSPVYGFLNADLEGDQPTVSGMSWICSPGSPCSHVMPRFPRTPEIFFRFRFDTTYSEGTYCDYRTEFTLRLHGLPMAFQTIARLTFGTTAACFGLLLLSYATRLACFSPEW